MRLLLTGRKVEITPALRQQIERKLTRLDRVLNDSAMSTQVVLSMEKFRHVTEIMVHARGDHMLTGVGTAETWPLSMKAAVEKIVQQAQKVKEKWQTRKRRAVGVKRLAAGARDTAELGPRPSRIIRAARYAVKPMNVEDAALSVESGDNAFVVFRNAATDSINILYRRKDGHFGLIDPEA